MKISIIVLVCVSSILYIKTAEGQFDGLVNTVHNAASTLGKGLGGILIPKKNKGGDNKDVGKPDDDNMKISTPTFPTEASPKADTPESPKADTPASPATTPKTSASVKPDEPKGEGKENFAGGCLAGYKKTADGRCMPTF